MQQWQCKLQRKGGMAHLKGCARSTDTPSPRGFGYWCSADNESHHILINTQSGEDTSCSAEQTSTSLHDRLRQSLPTRVVGNTTLGFCCTGSYSALVDMNSHFTSNSYYNWNLWVYLNRRKQKCNDLAVCLSSGSLNHWLMLMVCHREHPALSGGKSVGNDRWSWACVLSEPLIQSLRKSTLPWRNVAKGLYSDEIQIAVYSVEWFTHQYMDRKCQIISHSDERWIPLLWQSNCYEFHLHGGLHVWSQPDQMDWT